MDPRVMELRIRQWIPVFEEQAKSGLNKDEWCIINGINRESFFRWQRRVRSYLLEHGESAGQLTIPSTNEQADNECFVELHCAQTALPGIAALRNLHDDVVDERQLAAVLRAMKNAD